MSRCSGILATLFGLAALGPLVAVRQERPPRDPAFDRLIGTWTGEGEVPHGGEDEVEMRFHILWEWVLGDRFMRGTFQMTLWREGVLERTSEGHLYLRPTGERRAELWYFSSEGSGKACQGHAQAGQDTVTFQWSLGPEGEDEGRMVVRFEGEGEARMTLYEREDPGEEWMEVTVVRLRRS